MERFSNDSGTILQSYVAVQNVACNLVCLASDLSMLCGIRATEQRVNIDRSSRTNQLDRQIDSLRGLPPVRVKLSRGSRFLMFFLNPLRSAFLRFLGELGPPRGAQNRPKSSKNAPGAPPGAKNTIFQTPAFLVAASYYPHKSGAK